MSEWALIPAPHGPFPGTLAPENIAAYAAATGDRTEAVLDGRAVPAVFPAILIFEPQEVARSDIPAAIWPHVRGGVHGEHDIVIHRPLVPGERLDTSSWISAVRTSRWHADRHVVRTGGASTTQPAFGGWRCGSHRRRRWTPG